VVVGHSLGGFCGSALAAKYPNLPGKLVIVDAYPFFGGLSDPDITPAKAREKPLRCASTWALKPRTCTSATSIGRGHQDDGDQGLRSGAHHRVGLDSDRTAVPTP